MNRAAELHRLLAEYLVMEKEMARLDETRKTLRAAIQGLLEAEGKSAFAVIVDGELVSGPTCAVDRVVRNVLRHAVHADVHVAGHACQLVIDPICDDEFSLAQGPDALSRQERSALANDHYSLTQLHRMVWQRGNEDHWDLGPYPTSAG